MTITIRCPQCGAPLRLDNSLAGRKVRCSGCRETIVAVPEPEEEEPRLPARRPSVRLPAVDQPLIPRINRSRGSEDRDRPMPVWKREILGAGIYFVVVGGLLLLFTCGGGFVFFYTTRQASPVPTPPPVTQQPSELDRLLGELISINPPQRVQAADRLRQAEPNVPRREEVARALANCLQDRNAESTAAAAAALEIWATPSAVPALLDALKHESEAVRKSCYRTLGRLKDRRSAPALVKGLTTPDRADAAAALEAFGEQAEGALVSALSDPSPAARGAACRVLARVGTRNCLGALVRVADRDADPVVKRTAEAAARSIRARLQ